jgi:tRNA pseudouridine38-40 synthase
MQPVHSPPGGIEWRSSGLDTETQLLGGPDQPQRWALGVEYDGARYVGWQRQQDGVSVQALLEDAIGHVANHVVLTHCAGRTDAGVHALGQVVHFDTSARRSGRNWLLGINSRLPADIVVTWAKPVAQDFHARFGARARRYRYVIANQPLRPAVLSGGMTWWRYPLVAEHMHAAGQCLLGQQDFTSFRSMACQAKTAIRTLECIRVQRQGPYVVLDVRANAFLHHMVRNIAGVLLQVGQGVQPVDWVQEVLMARDRRVAGMTAPAAGLYFLGARYDPVFAIPEHRAVSLWSWWPTD